MDFKYEKHWPRCPKCGIYLYIVGKAAKYEKADHFAHEQWERIRCTCGECGYEWFEKTMDNQA